MLTGLFSASASNAKGRRASKSGVVDRPYFALHSDDDVFVEWRGKGDAAGEQAELSITPNKRHCAWP